MLHSKGWTFVVATLALVACGASAQKTVPSPLLAIDQNRSTVVERIVGEWGDRLAASNAGITSAQFREILTGLRADHLLAASLAGSVEGLRDVVSGALVHSDSVVSPGLIHTKALGDTTDDLVYTPVLPCRLVDTRIAGGAIADNSSRDFKVWVSSGGFTAQGGNPGNCNVPANPAAVALNLTVVTPAGLGNLMAYPTGGSAPDTSVLNYQPSTQVLANGAIIPACTPNCANQVTVKTNGAGTNLVIDIVGYFARPTNYGGTHVITGADATDSGGLNNAASGDYSTVAGGLQNTASGGVSTVGGGEANTAGNKFSTVAGGEANTASGGWCAVAGGNANVASGNFCTVAGGQLNTAGGYASTVGGGAGNAAGGDYSTVAGGTGNAASGYESTVAAGISNTASGQRSAVAGGAGNAASGDSSTVAGGAGNAASGTLSFAAGYLANANADGCVVFSDHSSGNITSCLTPNTFVVRAISGFYFFTGGNADANYTGAQLAGGSSAWSAYSDRNGKDNIERVNPRQVLAKLAAIPVATWNWKAQDARIRHMGPMAQDFHVAFGLGEDDKHITTVDSEGVALAAIQGLHQMLQQKDAKLSQQTREISVLKRELSAIKVKLGLN